TIAADEEHAYTADTFDQFGNHIADTTAETEFTIDGDASCDATNCTSTTAGEYTVTGTHDGMVATAELTVTPAAADQLVLSPPTATTTAGEEQAYTADSYDQFGNHIADTTDDTTFTINGDAACDAATCTSTTASEYTVTATYDGMVATGELTVIPAAADHLVLNPPAATITAGAEQTYTANSFDQFGNHIADTTADTTFTINGDASCGAAACTSTTAGDYTVTGTHDDLVATAELTVTAATADHLVLSPPTATIAAGEEQTYTADSYDQFGNHIADATGDTVFTINAFPVDEMALSPADSAMCDAATCTSTTAGDYTVTGTHDDLIATANLTITPATADHLVLSPPTATIAAGEEQSYTADSYDQFGNHIADTTADTTFTINGDATDDTTLTLADDASCDAALCTSTTAGQYTVTGTHDGLVATADLTITPTAADHLVLSPPTATINAGEEQPYTADSYDRFGNHIADTTADTTFTINGDATCNAATCTSTTAGEYTVTGTYGAAVGTAALQVTAVTEPPATPTPEPPADEAPTAAAPSAPAPAATTAPSLATTGAGGAAIGGLVTALLLLAGGALLAVHRRTRARME
ncbi:hypothetical protein, partial [Georgenia sp. MJ170]|uniref:hypothetical protein n=1 Tax=Georgenia sunbinii TaxID=3117728 RepID=UPI002F267AE7